MSRKQSAGVLLFRRGNGGVEVLLAHPGGPFWRNKDDGAWSIPKGEIGDDEDPEAAARRELEEETGYVVDPPLISLGTAEQKSGKVVHCFAAPGALDPMQVRSNDVTIEWPRGSGREISFPEIDRCAWFDPDTAREKANPAQAVFIDRLMDALA